MRTWLANTCDTFKSQLWPIPKIAVVAALLIGLGLRGPETARVLTELDSAVSGHLSGRVSGVLFGGDADAARSLLGAIASSLITVTALTFSLTVVTLQLASSQFSPRLLRTFTSDQFVQATLALFLATFTYALTVLRAVRSAGDSGQAEFVPKFAVTLAFLLAVASVLGLVLFLAHLTAQIRVETMLRNVHRDASRTMRAVLPERDHADGDQPPGQRPPLDAVPVLAHDDGFLTWIEQSDLVAVAVAEDALLSLDVHPGSFLVKGTPVGAAWPVSGGRYDQETADRVADLVAGCLHTGFERTASQDVGYGLRQLADVANKALSPGINDPTTAIHALGHISAFLCELHRSENDMASALLNLSDQQKIDHEIFYVARDIARWSQEHVRRLAVVGQDYGLELEIDPEDEATLLALLKQKGAELTGRLHEPGLLLLADLRHLHRMAAGVSLDWEVLAQTAQAMRDRQLLGLAEDCHPETLRQMRWANAKVKETAAQIMVTG